MSDPKAVTPKPTSKPRSVAWLTREHAVTVLPAVSSLKALRRVGKPSAAPRSMIGFGNPLLEGPDTRYANLAKDKDTSTGPRPSSVRQQSARMCAFIAMRNTRSGPTLRSLRPLVIAAKPRADAALLSASRCGRANQRARRPAGVVAHEGCHRELMAALN